MSNKNNKKKKQTRARRSWIEQFIRENPRLADKVPSQIVEKAKKYQSQ